MFKQAMLERVLKEATESTIETFRVLGPFKTKNSDIPMEIDFSNTEFRNEVRVNEDDEIYIGQFKVGTNIKEGRGIMLTSAKDLYEGYWVNGERCGKGRMIFWNGDIYQGDFVDSVSQGLGIFISEEGKYKGEWFDNQRHGFGTFIWADGRKYTGEWMEDRQHGKVAYIDSQGNKIIGEYINGEFHTGIEDQSNSNLDLSPINTRKILGQLIEHDRE
jgi:hypothetical protein